MHHAPGPTREEARDLLSTAAAHADGARLAALCNAVILGFQSAVSRILGRDFRGLTQLLIREVGEMVRLMYGDRLDGAPFSEALTRLVLESGLAREVEVQRQGSGYRVLMRGSVFKPLHRVLQGRGLAYTLSPEAMIAAALYAAHRRSEAGDGRVDVEARIIDEDTVEVILQPRGGL